MSDQNNQGSENMDQIYDNELNQETKNIVYNCQEIMTNIELDLPIQSIDDLYQEAIYIEMFKKMFPFMKKKVEQIEDSNASTGKKLQMLINGLSNDVLTMDLTHIQGQAIADKDPRHLLNFLQIILELSKLYVMKRDPNQDPNNDEQNHPEAIQDDEDHGKLDEEEDEGIYQNNEEQDEENVDPNLQNNNIQDQNVKHRLNKNPSFKNLIQSDKKEIENDIYSHPNQRVITNDPNIKQAFYDKDQNNYQNQYDEDIYDNEQNQDIQKIQELIHLYRSGALTPDDPKLQELQQLLAKNGITLGQIINYEDQNNQVLFENQNKAGNAINQTINHTRNKLQNMKKFKNLITDPTDQKVRGGSKKYQNYLKSYKKEYEKKMQRKQSSNNIDPRKEERKKRLSEHEDKMLQKEYQDEQLSLYYQMRDKKVQYLRNIHKIIFELEKKKIIDEQNEYKETKEKLEMEAKNRLISIENKYKDRILMLKEALEQQRRDRHIEEVAQRQELSRQERELKQIKRKQIEDLKDLWRSEREKFDLITKDDRKLESEILQLYKKY
ncbi:kinesin motor domain protein (macronuclear) [Tetrahymena thermophila SB210]|uniref:Kinesin motor domain protein n=1 Tax=Tetrahymena thermophila (strain SB210) TaxID=312017 RepID=I7LXY5_TETTS|nr:kinesin motor domain protein [Tetrahymena thermophila SB210]EAS06994.2 kinesin motor domain protein [Tetrahymena thermophila SB210]|eukprot:XP_001027236.2 kinesin motor domain protein [Tetrahymena thermophila SB210]